ncbi:unnamed protein product [Dimorphilus gyrociliatus]|uniref:Uncharacterized protein n=1 Tax=Dimorphilus gyrociliatus TaxID=2664684 RepID=A0A7I8V7W2_9ANNE|nr:unnamed protein product [Dimorphilus gyrociliatus]
MRPLRIRLRNVIIGGGAILFVIAVYYFSHRKSHQIEIPSAKGSKDGMTSAMMSTIVNQPSFPNYNVHIFYYPWYGTPGVDKKWLHWNHPYLEHWNKIEQKKWPTGRHSPPDDLGSTFYPKLGPYSSKNETIINNHMEQIKKAGVGVLVLTWYPPGSSDENGAPLDPVTILVLDSAHKHELKVCFHIEPYQGRNAQSMNVNIKYIIDKYGKHPAFYRRVAKDGRELPVYYIYDSYNIPAASWSQLLRPNSGLSLRGGKYDGIFIGLLVEEKHKIDLIGAGFDGFYTYFASDKFSFGSTLYNWKSLAEYAQRKNVLFIPSVGPGYNDRKVRPWNYVNNRNRDNGKYYERSLKMAFEIKPSILSITSFNEWHEGTQIEEAVPHLATGDGGSYDDYSPNMPDFYLTLTRTWLSLSPDSLNRH